MKYLVVVLQGETGYNTWFSEYSKALRFYRFYKDLFADNHITKVNFYSCKPINQ